MKRILYLIYFCLILDIGLFISGCDSSSSRDVDNRMRIVATYRPATHVVAALGQLDSLVGIQDHGGEMPLFCKIRPSIDALPFVGSKMDGISAETIASLKPDIVIFYPSAKGTGLHERLEKFGIESYFLRMESIAEMQMSFQELGIKLGMPARAQVTITEMQRILKLVSERVQKANIQKPKRVFMTASFRFLVTNTHAMLQHEMMTLAGTEDVSTIPSGSWATISLEQLLVWNPDMIVLSGAAKFTPEEIIRDLQYQTLQAVVNKQVFRMPHQKLTDWDYPGPDSVLGVLWLSMMAYPEIYKDIVLDDEIEQYHKTLYNISAREMIQEQSNSTKTGN